MINRTNGLPSNSVRCIAEDPRGYYYVGTTSSLVILKLSDGLRVHETIPEIVNAVSLCADQNGFVAAVTEEGKLYVLHGTEMIAERIPENGDEYHCCAFDGAGKLYAGGSADTIDVYRIAGSHLEKNCAKELIDEGCVIISQDTDTSGPAAACEESERSQAVYYVSYNESMRDIAPTTYLTGSRINRTPYMTAAVRAVLEGKAIEKCVEANVHGTDAGAGFENGWVQLLELNGHIAAEGTEQQIEELVEDFKEDKVHVFYGNYTGTNPDDPSDRIDLREEYRENENSSAPSFHYVLDHVISIR